jgi:hypothetical protein
MRKTFLLGVGCQKGGTSWLYDYLGRHPNANLGFRKEYHVFDGLYVPEFAHHHERVRKRAAALLDGTAPRSANARNTFRLLNFYTDIESYFDYFWSLANRSAETTLTGDITPTYAALPRQAFGRIREALQKRSFDIRVVFLLRDPVERVISQVRMRQRTASRESADIREAFATRTVELRTRYELTIANLEAVFGKEEIFYCFYERLFSEESIRRATSFLSIPYLAPDFDRKVNVSGDKSELDQATRRKIFDHYRATYDFVAQRFGRADVGQVWQSYREFA